jgi:hypothetical protein
VENDEIMMMVIIIIINSNNYLLNNNYKHNYFSIAFLFFLLHDAVSSSDYPVYIASYGKIVCE